VPSEPASVPAARVTPPLLRAHRSVLPSALTTTLRIRGDATDDGSLRAAGIDRAAGLVAVAGDDATNIVVTLSACAPTPDLDIVARAILPEVEDKLRRAGATHVISPYRFGGQRIVTQRLHPRITEFLDVVAAFPRREAGDRRPATPEPAGLDPR